MVRVRCPECQTVFAVTTRAPVCPSCGFSKGAGSSRAAAPAAAPAAWTPEPMEAESTFQPPAAEWTPEPETSSWLPDETEPSAAAPQGRSRRTLFMVAGLVALVLLLGGGTAYYLLYSPWSPFNDEDTLSEDDLYAALTELAQVLSGEKREAWGVDGELGVSPVPGAPQQGMEILLVKDPDNEAYHIRLKLSAEQLPLEFEKKQRGTVLNFHLQGKTYVGRDEDPSTLPALEFTTIGSADRLRLQQFQVDEIERDDLEGRAATRFIGHNATVEAMSVWVYHDTKQVAKVQVDDEEGRFEVRILRGSDATVEVVTTGDARASFNLESSEAHNSFGEPGWAWTNGSVTEKHVEEVRLNEVEMHAVRGSGDQRQSLASMALPQGSKTQDEYTFAYVDADGDGFVSAGDSYSLRQPDDEDHYDVSLAFRDTWANAWEGGPLPGFEWVWALAVAVAVGVAFGRRRRD